MGGAGFFAGAWTACALAAAVPSPGTPTSTPTPTPTPPSTPPATEAQAARYPTEPSRAARRRGPRAGAIVLESILSIPVHFVAYLGVVEGIGLVAGGEARNPVGAAEDVAGSGAVGAVGLGVALAGIAPLASSAVVWGIGQAAGDGPPFVPTYAAGAAAQLAGYGLVLATGSRTVALVSVTALPAAAEVVTANVLAEPQASPSRAGSLDSSPAAAALPPGVGRPPCPGPPALAVVPVLAGRF